MGRSATEIPADAFEQYRRDRETFDRHRPVESCDRRLHIYATMNKFVKPRPYADPEAAARELLANAHEPYMDGRILIERLNGAMLYQHMATPAEYKAGLNRAIERGWLELHESGTFVRFTQAGADLFAWKNPRL